MLLAIKKGAIRLTVMAAVAVLAEIRSRLWGTSVTNNGHYKPSEIRPTLGGFK